jgi:hypothetical protein
VLLGLTALFTACGGPDATLIRLRASTDQAEPRLLVRNASEATIEGFYLAPTGVVREAKDHTVLGSEAEAVTWGNDLLTRSLLVGEAQPVRVAESGHWDARPVDEQGRYQHIVGLRLRPHANYVLEVHDGTWRQFR